MVQYMSFPWQANERRTLVPVIGMLLQFSREELLDIERAENDPSWNPKPVKELKRTPVPSKISMSPVVNGQPQLVYGASTKKWKTPPSSPQIVLRRAESLESEDGTTPVALAEVGSAYRARSMKPTTTPGGEGISAVSEERKVSFTL